MPKVNLERERVSGLPGQKVTPMASVRPAYVAAPAISGGDQLEQLASSLGSLSPKLQRLSAQRSQAKIKASEEAEKKEQDRQEALANQTLAGMTLDQVNQNITDGTLQEYDNPYFKAAVDKIRGVRTATAEARDLSEKIASGVVDPSSDDFEHLITSQSATTLKGASEHFTSGYHNTMFRERERLLQAQTNARIAETEQERTDGAHTILRDVVLNGGAPEEVVAKLQMAKSEVKASLNMSFGEMDEIILDIAEEIALSGDAERVEGILTSKRTGSNGEDLGSISSKKGYGAKAQTLIQRAKNIRDADKVEKDYSILMEYDDMIASGNVTQRDIRSDERLTGADQRSLSNQLRSADVRRAKEAAKVSEGIKQDRALRTMEVAAVNAVNSGSGFMLDDMEVEVGGKTVKMSASEAREFGLNAAVQQRVQALSEQFDGEVPSGMTEAVIEKLVQSNATTYKPWEKSLNAVNSIAQHANISGATELPPQLSSAYDLYQSVSRTTAEQHIKDEGSRNLLRSVFMAETYMGMSEEQAWQHAISVREGRLSGNTGVTTAAISKEIDTLDFTKWKYGVGPKANFEGIMRRDIGELARQLSAGSGVSAQDAVTEASRIYMDTHVLIDGVALPVPNGYSKASFKDVSQGFMTQWRKRFNTGAYGEGWGDNTILYDDPHLRSMDGGRNFMVFDGLTPLGPRHTYSVENFRRFQRERQLIEENEEREKALQAANNRNAQATREQEDYEADEYERLTGDKTP